jgi:dihydroxyacetone kinase
MKLRIHKNSIRLRLSQQEVDTIGRGSPIIEMVEMGMGKENNFGYSLIPLDHIDEISAQYVQNILKVSFPTHKAKEWADTDTVSISKVADNNLSILIEKDFQCLHERPGEDESNNFPNPDAH